jgi:hypothetical protein
MIPVQGTSQRSTTPDTATPTNTYADPIQVSNGLPALGDLYVITIVQCLIQISAALKQH